MSKVLFQQLLFVILLIALWFVVKDDPIYGDGVVNVSRAAVEIYKNDLTIAYYKDIPDPGHPTLIPFLLAVTWKIAGFTLPVTHAFNILIAFFFLWAFGKLCRHFLKEITAFWAQFIFGISSIVIAQTAILSPQLLTFGLFFLALYFVLKKQFGYSSLFLALMVLTHLQGVFLWGLILLWYLLPVKELKYKLFNPGFWVMVLLPMLMFGIWLWYHQVNTGWLLFSPDYMRDSAGIKGIVYNLAMSIWRLVDHGFVIFWVLILFAFRKILSSEQGKLLLFFTVGLMLLLSYTISFGIAHRYFIPVYGLLILTAFSFEFNIKKLVFSFVLLAAGHFLYYPGKIPGDQTLHYRSFFKLENELKVILQNDKACAHTPIAFPRIYTHLEDQSVLNILPLYDKDPAECAWLLESNITIGFAEDLRKELENKPVHSIQSGVVYINVYLNHPDEEKLSRANWVKRKTGKMEQFISHLKSKIQIKK
jgi:hypothetical protein